MIKKIFFALLIGSIAGLQAQTSIPEEKLFSYPRLTMSEALAMDPDSVLALRVYGNSEDFYEEDPADYIDVSIFNFRNLQILEILRTHAEHIITEIDRFPQLQYLEMRTVGMDNLPEAFYSLVNLKELKLMDFHAIELDTLGLLLNEIHSLSLEDVSVYCPEEREDCEFPLGLFPELRYLKMDNQYRLSNSLLELQYLEELDLSKGVFTDLEGIEVMQSLKKLDLSYNENLEFLPYAIGNLENLEELRIQEAPLAELPGSICDLHRLRELTISGTPITTLPENFGQLGSLERLLLYDSELSSLPASFGELSALSSLDFSSNKFTHIPDAICRLSTLKYLNLDRNDISTLPACFSNLKQLRTLYMESNSLSHFEAGALDLPSLEWLDLNYCTLGQVPAAIGGLSGLKTLEMQWCGIKWVDPALLGLGKLEYLDLLGNELTALPAGWKGLKNMEVLNLEQNKISALPKDLFAMKNLTHLDLSFNNIKTLPKGLGKLSRMHTLQLAGNTGIKIPKEIKKLDLTYLYLKIGDLKDKDLAKVKKWVGENVVILSDYDPR